MSTALKCILLLLALRGMLAWGQQAPAAPILEPGQITGSWEGTDNTGDQGTFQFQPGGFARILFRGQQLPPPALNVPTLRYEINASKEPMWLDFVARDAAGKELGRIKFIFRMTGPKEMVVRAGDDPAIRPVAFDDADKESTITLKKVY